MRTTRTMLTIAGAYALLSAVGGSSRAGAQQAQSQPSRETRQSASPACRSWGNYTTLEFGKAETTEPKKITNGCWWQFRVPPIHGYVQEWLGWQVCNACDVDIEFELRNLPGAALASCNLFLDASNSARETIARGVDRIYDCLGVQPVKEVYSAGARVAGQTSPFVPDDPELEIEDRALPEVVAHLAETSAVSSCVSQPNVAGSRLIVSGMFTRTRSGGFLVLVPTGSTPFSTTWSADLVELAPRGAKALPEREKGARFNLSTDIPPFVTQFMLRDSTGRKNPLMVGKIEPCK